LYWELFRGALDHLFASWGDGDYSYAWMIPFVIVFLVWQKRDKFFAEPVENAWWGIVPLVLGIALFALGELGGEYYTMYLSAWAVLVGVLWLQMGRRRMKVLVFPVFLVLTTFPLPAFLYNKASVQLQMISSRIGAAILQAIGIVVHREGNVIDIGVTQLQVIEACSGLRYVFPLLVLGILVAYFFRASTWKRVFLVLSTIPLTIFWNSMRIALTGVLWLRWGKVAGEGFFHDFSGFVIFLVSLVALLGEMRVLGKIGGSGRHGTGREPSYTMEKGRDEGPCPLAVSDSETTDGRPDEKVKKDAAANYQSEKGKPSCTQGKGEPRNTHWRPLLPCSLTALGLLGATLACFQAIDFQHKIPIREPLSMFPLNIADWHGIHGSLSYDELETLKFSDYTMINYRNKSGIGINFYVAYFESQVKGGSIHSPETCLPGHGWVFQESATLNVPVKYGKGYLKVNRTVAEQVGSKILSYFWFQQRGRDLTNIYQIKFYNFWDALTQRRTDGALVRLITPISGAESVDEAGARLNEFLNQTMPILDRFIPGRDAQAVADRISPVQSFSLD
jgi:EpsI family protein